MHWMVLPYRRYFDFAGRSRRMEYWMFVLFQLLVSAVIGALFGSPEYVRQGLYASFTNSLSTAGGLIENIFGLVSFIPGLAVAVRRLHDQDRTGWLLLLVLIPLFGWFAVLVLMCLDGTPGPNRFGPDPKNPTDIDVFA
jgi:uncharacterized membrane protein YhaH (DUF805 family)